MIHSWSIHNIIFLCWSGWLWQPAGVLRRGPRPGVMGSRMCAAWLPWGLCQGVRVPLLDRRRPQSQCLREFPDFCSLSISPFLYWHPPGQPLVHFLTDVRDQHTKQHKINQSCFILTLFICLFIILNRKTTNLSWQNNIQDLQATISLKFVLTAIT